MISKKENISIYENEDESEITEIPKTFSVSRGPNGKIDILGVPEHLKPKILEKYFTGENVIQIHNK